MLKVQFDTILLIRKPDITVNVAVVPFGFNLDVKRLLHGGNTDGPPNWSESTSPRHGGSLS